MKVTKIFFLLLFPLFLLGQNTEGPKKDIKSILGHISAFSEHVVAGQADKIAEAYTTDAKIFPGNSRIIEGREAIQQYWTPAGERKIVYHKILPEEITVQGKKAYDYGYYEGKTRQEDGSEVSWKGKYVIVWKKVNGDWQIYLDIWNRVEE